MRTPGGAHSRMWTPKKLPLRALLQRAALRRLGPAQIPIANPPRLVKTFREMGGPFQCNQRSAAAAIGPEATQWDLKVLAECIPAAQCQIQQDQAPIHWAPQWAILKEHSINAPSDRLSSSCFCPIHVLTQYLGRDVQTKETPTSTHCFHFIAFVSFAGLRSDAIGQRASDEQHQPL